LPEGCFGLFGIALLLSRFDSTIRPRKTIRDGA